MFDVYNLVKWRYVHTCEAITIVRAINLSSLDISSCPFYYIIVSVSVYV